MTRVSHLLLPCALTAATLLCVRDAKAWQDPDPVDEDTVVELHFMPAPDAQIAVWLTDADGNFIRDLFLTQATGKLGIGNRSGLWNFLSSWRAPYGPRKSVLPIWAHARGQTYPKIVFHDPNPGHATSLGFHEATSSAEPYHCRPLMENEHEAILDSMTCPSPATFRTDKGKFDEEGATSVYPPRGDIAAFDEFKDHVDTQMYAELNEVDGVTAATPAGNAPAIITVLLTDEEKMMPELQVWFEINTEHDENPDWDFDRETDHFVDPLLSSYGIEYLGQPSVVYNLSFNPSEEGTWTTDEYVGYGAWNGDNGDINPPDTTISNSDGSGADRLQMMDAFDTSFRLAVHAGEGGSCHSLDLPNVTDLELEPIAFDEVLVSFTLPDDLPPESVIRHLQVKYEISSTTDTFDPDKAIDASNAVPPLCAVDQNGAPIVEADCLPAMPGQRVQFVVGSLFGNYDYTFSVNYSDQCANSADDELADTRTLSQAFQQVDTFCFVATAAYGAH
jgi:hypothetical protein